LQGASSGPASGLQSALDGRPHLVGRDEVTAVGSGEPKLYCFSESGFVVEIPG
jgi:hypothetical protein